MTCDANIKEVVLSIYVFHCTFWNENNNDTFQTKQIVWLILDNKYHV